MGFRKKKCLDVSAKVCEGNVLKGGSGGKERKQESRCEKRETNAVSLTLCAKTMRPPEKKNFAEDLTRGGEDDNMVSSPHGNDTIKKNKRRRVYGGSRRES